jgi:hypothetical protein
MSKDFKKFDKHGNPLNLMPKFNHSRHGDYYTKWLEDSKRYEPSYEDIKCELQLSALGVYEPLDFLVNISQFNKEIKPWNDKWVPYLRREGTLNDREGLLLMGLDGDNPCNSLSMPEAKKRTGKQLIESDFNVPTALYQDLKSLHPLLDFFQPLGRTMLVKSNAGGFFPPHKDAPNINRDCFRIVIFIGKSVDHEAYQWEIDGRVMPIKQNRAYYVDTRKTHRTHSWVDDSIHCVINVPKTWENVMKLMSMCKLT